MVQKKYKKLIHCTLIGYGKWGKNIYNILTKEKNLNIDIICKKNADNFKNPKFKGKVIESYKSAINNKIDAVFIASPPKTHFEIIKYALEKKKDVFVEKPVCLNNKDFNKLKKLAEKNSLVLHVDYIHQYNQNLIELAKRYKKNIKHKMKTFNIKLGKNGPTRKKSFVLIDWCPHIFSIINFILKDNNYKIIKSKIDSSNNHKTNFYLEIKYKDININVLFGNNFKRKITLVKIRQGDVNYIYKDKKLSIKNKRSFSNINYQNITPLENSIKKFLELSVNSKFVYDKLNDNVTHQLESLKKLLN